MGNCFSTPEDSFSTLEERNSELEEARAQRYADGSTTCRILHVNDIYKLDNLPKLKTLLDQARADAVAEGIPAANTFVTLAGDFLGPSLLSSLDSGKSMIGCLNRLDVDYLMFGNHECDVPLNAQAARIREFKGTWINTNMPGYQVELPQKAIVDLAPSSEAGKDRKLALIALLMHAPDSYGDGVYGGAEKNIQPVAEAGPEWYQKIRTENPEVDTIVPLTHQSLADDAKTAQTGLFPVVVAGHDHDLCTEQYESTGEGKNSPVSVLKAGQNAVNLISIDLVWPKDLPTGSDPASVTYTVHSVEEQKPDPRMEAYVKKAMAPVVALQSAVLYIVQEEEGLSNDRVRFGPSSLAIKICSVLRSAVKADLAWMQCGFFKDKEVELKQGEGLTFSELQKVTPRDPNVIIVHLPGSVVKECIFKTRADTWVKYPDTEQGLALQVDDNCILDADNNVTHIKGQPFDEKRVYAVATVPYCANKLRELVPAYDQWAKDGGVIPDGEDGRPWMSVLVQEFAAILLGLLIDKDGDGEVTEQEMIDFVTSVDTDKSGSISRVEVAKAVQERLNTPSEVIVDKLMLLMDNDDDEVISLSELKRTTTELSSHDLLFNVSDNQAPQKQVDRLDSVVEAPDTEPEPEPEPDV